MADKEVGGVEGAAYGHSDSGWMVDKNFENWFRDFFLPNTQEIAGNHHRVLIFDGHNSHLTYPTIRAAIDNNVSIICLPPGTSHALQPLDVGVFRSVKVVYSDECLKFFRKARGTKISKDYFPGLIKSVWARLEPENARAGFKKSGLYPYNPAAIRKKILAGSGSRGPSGTAQDGTAQDEPAPDPSDPFRLMREAVSEVIRAQIGPSRETAEPRPKRRRVQATCGEVLTTEVVAERLRLEQIEREEKKRKKSTATTSKASSGVSISFRPPSDNAERIVTGGTLDSFVTREPTMPSEEVDPPEEAQPTLPSVGVAEPSQVPTTSGASTLLQRNVSDFFAKSARKGSSQSRTSLYREASSFEDDPDDPESDCLPSKDELAKGLKAGVSHVIFKYEGSHFPGLITKINKTNIKIKSMVKSGTGNANTSWNWPGTENLRTRQLCHITDVIPTPELVSNRGPGYFVQKIDKYW